MSISPSEISYIRQSCVENFRIDGRSNLQHRPYTLLSPSSSPILSNGSSRLFLPGSTTDILCSIRAELIHPNYRSGSEGIIDVNVDLLPFATANLTDRKTIRKEEMEVASTLTHLLLPHLLDRNILIVLEGRYVWRLNIDIMVVHCDGNLIDACSMAIWGAMQNLRLPNVVPVQKVGAGAGAGGNSGGENQSHHAVKKASDEIMLDGDIANAVMPTGVTDCPIVITIYLIPTADVVNATQARQGMEQHSSSTRVVKKKQESSMIVDPSKQEEACASTKISVSVDTSGNICGIHKYGSSSVLSGNISGNIGFGMLPQIQTMAISCSEIVFELMKRNHRDSNAATIGSDEYNNFFRGQFELQ